MSNESQRILLHPVIVAFNVPRRTAPNARRMARAHGDEYADEHEKNLYSH